MGFVVNYLWFDLVFYGWVSFKEKLEETGNDPQDEFGFASPYAEFNRMYGGFRAGHVYAIASRPGEGKSTWLNDVCFKVAENSGIKALLLDTEMLTKEIKFRL